MNLLPESSAIPFLVFMSESFKGIQNYEVKMMELNQFDELWLEENGITESDISYLNERLDYEFPQEFIDLYKQTNGFRASLNELYIEFWGIDQIVSFNEIYEDVIDGQHVFFASSDEGYDSYAYKKGTDEIYVFPTDCGVDDIEDGQCCANDLDGLIAYLQKKLQRILEDSEE